MRSVRTTLPPRWRWVRSPAPREGAKMETVDDGGEVRRVKLEPIQDLPYPDDPSTLWRRPLVTSRVGCMPADFFPALKKGTNQREGLSFSQPCTVCTSAHLRVLIPEKVKITSESLSLDRRILRRPAGQASLTVAKSLTAPHPCITISLVAINQERTRSVPPAPITLLLILLL